VLHRDVKHGNILLVQQLADAAGRQRPRGRVRRWAARLGRAEEGPSAGALAYEWAEWLGALSWREAVTVGIAAGPRS